jgi:hypothetical protein
MNGNLNYDEEGKMIAKIGKKIVYINDKSVEDGFNELKCKGDNLVQQIPDKNTERSILYITAPSGSGKSYYTKQYIEEYHKSYPKRDVFIFSSLDSDTTLDKLKYIKRIKIKNQEFLDMELTAQDFKDSLVIFDDTDCLTNKPIKMKVLGILNQILEVGRHHNVSLVYTSHLATDGNNTKRILNEAHSITIFPKNMGLRGIKYLLEMYLGLDKNEIKKIKNISGRWVTVQKTYPMCFFGEKEIWCRSNC